MTALIPHLIAAVYFIGVAVAWVPMTRRVVARDPLNVEPRCHGRTRSTSPEGVQGFTWNKHQHCLDYCEEDCWSVDESDQRVLISHVIVGLVLSLLWFFSVVVFHVQRAAGAPPRVSLRARRQINRAVSAATIKVAVAAAEAEAAESLRVMNAAREETS